MTTVVRYVTKELYTPCRDVTSNQLGQLEKLFLEIRLQWQPPRQFRERLLNNKGE